MSRPIGALFHVPHGLSNAMLLDKCLSFALPGAMDRFARLGVEIGATDAKADTKKAAEAFLSKLRSLCRELNVPMLYEYGIAKDNFENHITKMARDAMASGSPSNTRRKVALEDMENIYMSLYD